MDDFTFPTMPTRPCSLPFPHFTSPPPWFLADVADAGSCNHRRSFSAVERPVDEEKMDMLWEDFNEELARTPPVCPLNNGPMRDVAFADDMEPCRRARAGSVVRRRRASLLLMLKLLKKLFLVHKCGAPSKAPAGWDARMS